MYVNHNVVSYSNNVVTGLAGIQLGNFMIKRVSTQLQREFPSINTFVTLLAMSGCHKQNASG